MQHAIIGKVIIYSLLVIKPDNGEDWGEDQRRRKGRYVLRRCNVPGFAFGSLRDAAEKGRSDAKTVESAAKYVETDIKIDDFNAENVEFDIKTIAFINRGPHLLANS